MGSDRAGYRVPKEKRPDMEALGEGKLLIAVGKDPGIAALFRLRKENPYLGWRFLAGKYQPHKSWRLFRKWDASLEKVEASSDLQHHTVNPTGIEPPDDLAWGKHQPSRPPVELIEHSLHQSG